jgi:hypothetical protein
MRKSNLNDGLQFFASVGVLVGLMMVAYEIRQNNDLAEADSVRAMLVGWQQIAISEYETDITDLYIKSLEEPENLTPAEVSKISAWLTVVMNQYMLTFAMYDRGLGYESGDLSYDPESELISGFDYYYGSRFGRAWFQENRFWIDSQLVEILDREMESRPVDSGTSYVERIKARL